MMIHRHWLRTAGALTLAAAMPLVALAQTGNPGGAINDNLGDMDYGVCRGTDPVCFHDWSRPESDDYRVLLFTKTAGPRHAHLGTPLTEGLNPPLADDNIVHRALGKLLSSAGIMQAGQGRGPGLGARFFQLFAGFVEAIQGHQHLAAGELRLGLRFHRSVSAAEFQPGVAAFPGCLVAAQAHQLAVRFEVMA